MERDFLQELKHLGFTARIKRLNESIVASTVNHYSNMNLALEPNWHVIFLLLKQRNTLTVTEMAQTLGFSHPAMIKTTRKMKEQGYLEHQKDALDQRKTLIRLSKKGKRLLPKFEKEWNRIQEVLQEVVDDALLKKLDTLEQNLKESSFSERYAIHFESLKKDDSFTIRNALPSEFQQIGQLMVEVYSGLDGFPKQEDQPGYYHTLANIGDFTKKPNTELLVAVSPSQKILGGVLYFGDMKYYGSGGMAPQMKNASGFRLLAVSSSARGLGVGKALSMVCIDKAKEHGNMQVLIHSTAYMKPARKMYRKLGFLRYPKLDFEQEGLEVHGFRLILK
ncbi:bifunctional helix-turn-helix transcriptional regulator/GNAT family N-acetyltransferase [Flagellimonas algicola]|uniref:GNAT family N-acetyltransferase n=1 Tax=Flagellimonas algicola TaxID=2583815 RepID=A0ABY2WPR1_9FLAO|nr:bifunctional helix-turn-helix transcriptional regulator/GNAT family N-acetyltransferase [Allomuricauda algicola]TMU56970.1 GNAT family N-acetyltransferase [Allomuricauda algicola]